MATPATAIAAQAAAVLNALVPLYSCQDNPNVVSGVVAAIRDAHPPPDVLANALYAFSKVVAPMPEVVPAFREVVNSLVATTLLPRDVLYESIDVETHQIFEPAIARPAEEKRTRTRLWFTQTRFNLFREESEGYAKVTTLMWETVEASDDVDPNKVVEAMLALVGQFCLDELRVIEVVLSAATDVIAEKMKRAGNIPFDHRLPPLFARLLDEFPRRHVITVVGTMLQLYHPVMPFELASDNSTPKPAAPSDGAVPSVTSDGEKSAAEAKAAAPKTPEAFYYLIGILIREGRMRIADVWNNMYPRDDRELARKFLGYEEQLQALSEHVSSPSASRPPTPQTPAIFVRSGTGASERDIFSQYKFVTLGPFVHFPCQKLHFIFILIIMCRVDDVLDAILSLGVNDEHIDVAAHPVIAQALAAFAEALLNPLLIGKFPGFYRKNHHITDAIRKLGGRANRFPCTVATAEELFGGGDDSPGGVIMRMLQVLGPHARTSPGLLQALCRIVKGRNEPRAVAIIRDVVLPASSLLQSNVGLTDDIWEVVRDWSHEVRWELYGHLQNVVADFCAVYQIVARRASYEMKYVLKRLTKESQKQHVTTIGKIARGQALPAFSAAIDRIQGYPPDTVTVSPVIDACQDCSKLAVDMLLFLIVDRMADSRRSRLKEDGINIAQWYATLSLFLGLCLRKLPVNSQQIEGVLSFLYAKLVVYREALLITALSDIIKCVADIEVETNLTAKQIEAQSGGPKLRTAVSGTWGRIQPDVKMVGQSLGLKVERERTSAVVALLTAFRRTGMHAPIAIAIAQMSRDAIRQEELRTMPLKLSANIVDRARSSLSQMSRFMDSSPNNTIWAKDLGKDIWRPLRELGLSGMVLKMNVLTPFAIVLMAPVVHYLASGPCANREGPEEKSDLKGSSLSENKNGESKKATKDESNAMTGTAMEVDDHASEGVKKPSSSNRLVDRDALLRTSEKQSIHAFARAISSRTENFVPAEFVRAFWTLRLDDLVVPLEMYETERKRLVLVRATWEKEVERNRRHNSHIDSDRRRRCEEELREIREFIESLDSEKAALVKKKNSTLESLKASHEHISSLQKEQTDKEKVVRYVLQECIVPRSKQSICDAIYCSKFLLLMLDLDIPVLSFSKYFEVLLKITPVLLCSCSENEALSFSRLLKEVLSTLEKWRSNRKIFDSEVASSKKHGFRDSESADAKPMRHEQYCQWLFDIHENFTDGLCLVLANPEYLYARNSLCVLAGIADVFPKVSEHSAKIEACVAKMARSELPDIRLSSTGVLARLKSGKAKRLPRHVFKLKPSSGGSSLTGSGSGKKKPLSQDSSRPSVATVSKVAKPAALSGAPTKKPKDEPRPEEKPRPLEESISASANGNLTSDPSSDKSKKAEVEKPSLNPKAEEFIPKTNASSAVKGSDKSATSGTSTGKRERDAGRGPEQGSGGQESGHGKQKAVAPAAEPPSKRPKGGDTRREESASRKIGSDKLSDTKSSVVKSEPGSGAPAAPEKVPARMTAGQKASGQKAAPNRDSAPRVADKHDGADRGKSGPPGRNGSNREGSGRDGPSRGSSGGREVAVRPSSRRESAGRRSSPQEEPARSPPIQKTVVRSPARREASGRGAVGVESSARSPQRREPAGRGIGERDSHGRNPTVPEISVRASGDRNGPGGRDVNSRNEVTRVAPKRESPSHNIQRHSSRGELPTRDVNGVSGKDGLRRRRSSDGQGGYQFAPPGDARRPGRESQEFDESFGEGHGVKRRREVNPQRDSYTLDGENRRVTRQRTEGSYRDRASSREDPPNVRYNGPQSPPRESGRFDNGFPGQGPKQGWAEHGRPRPHDGPSNGGGPRQRDLEPEAGGGWKGRPGERIGEFEGRDRQGGRSRDDTRDGEYRNYEDRGATRGGERYRERRTGGRDDRGPRDRPFNNRRSQGRPSGRRRG